MTIIQHNDSNENPQSELPAWQSLGKDVIHRIYKKVYDSQEKQINFYASIPNIADDNLNLHEYRLYGHYVRVCGQNGGCCNEAEETTAKHCGMGKHTLRETRKSLAEKGFIKVITGTPHKAGKKGIATQVYLQNVWPENILTYDKKEQGRTARETLLGLVIGNGSEQTCSSEQSDSDETCYGSDETPSNDVNGSNQTSQGVQPELKEEKEHNQKKLNSALSAQSAAPSAGTTYLEHMDEGGKEITEVGSSKKVKAATGEERGLISFLNRVAAKVRPKARKILESTKVSTDHMGNEVEHMSPVERFDFDPNFKRYVDYEVRYWRDEARKESRSMEEKMVQLAYILADVTREKVGYFDWCKERKIKRRRTLEEVRRYLLPGESAYEDENGNIVTCYDE